MFRDTSTSQSVASTIHTEPLEQRTLLSAAVGLGVENNLVRFDANRPQIIQSNVSIKGLPSNERVVGIDYRPNDQNDDGINKAGLLYGVTNRGGVVTLDPITGQATSRVQMFVDSNGNGMRDAGEEFTLRSAAYGVDFNPTVDRLRVVNGLDDNLRINVDTGLTLVDTPLAYSVTDTNAGKNPRITAIAYTNNDLDPGTGTVLYDIDVDLDILANQTPANSGTLNTVGTLRNMSGRVNTSAQTGMDIITMPNGFNKAYTALTFQGETRTRIAEIDLTSGALRGRGVLGSNDAPVVISDIALVQGYSSTTASFASTPIASSSSTLPGDTLVGTWDQLNSNTAALLA